MIRNVSAEIWLVRPEIAGRVLQRIGTVLDWAYASKHDALNKVMLMLGKAAMGSKVRRYLKIVARAEWHRRADTAAPAIPIGI